jgi:hypothetical protein
MSILPTKFYKINPTTAILVVSNISILVLALILDWSLLGIVMTYWAENLVIGVLNIPKIIMAKQQHPGHRQIQFGAKLRPSFSFVSTMFCLALFTSSLSLYSSRVMKL